jgi:hypothetical protein
LFRLDSHHLESSRRARSELIQVNWNYENHFFASQLWHSFALLGSKVPKASEKDIINIFNDTGVFQSVLSHNEIRRIWLQPRHSICWKSVSIPVPDVIFN